MSERRPIPPELERAAPHDLIEQLLTMPGRMGDTYNRLHTYSPGNQALLYMQGVMEPVAPYRKWPEFNRYVLKGSRGKYIYLPVTRKVANDKGELEQRVTGFMLRPVLFGLSDTAGEDLPEYEPPTWSPERAMGNLAIRRVAFEHLDGNTMGYSVGREVAINPIAPYPLKTLMHELGHVVIGHTTQDGLQEYRSHRGIFEFQAEATAYLVLNELGELDKFDASESRAYVQQYLRGERPPEPAIRQVLSATQKILNAGRETSEEVNDDTD